MYTISAPKRVEIGLYPDTFFFLAHVLPPSKNLIIDDTFRKHAHRFRIDPSQRIHSRELLELPRSYLGHEARKPNSSSTPTEYPFPLSDIVKSSYPCVVLRQQIHKVWQSNGRLRKFPKSSFISENGNKSARFSGHCSHPFSCPNKERLPDGERPMLVYDLCSRSIARPTGLMGSMGVGTMSHASDKQPRMRSVGDAPSSRQ